MTVHSKERGVVFKGMTISDNGEMEVSHQACYSQLFKKIQNYQVVDDGPSLFPERREMERFEEHMTTVSISQWFLGILMGGSRHWYMKGTTKCDGVWRGWESKNL